MGGRALKDGTFTRRYERQEFEDISKELTERLQLTFKRVDVPLFYKNKETFGDADILVSLEGLEDKFNMREFIIDGFKPNEIFHNGNCWSFDYKELQIDIITVSGEHYDSTLNYLSYNDFGNLVGRLAHGFGLKYGQTGLFYEHEFKGSNIGTIMVSKNYPSIFKFLGLSYEKYIEGFTTLEEIFDYIAESPYFNWKRYQFSELNKINRDRNNKRSSYTAFLKWIDDNVRNEEHEYQFKVDKSEYFDLINNAFPESDLVSQIRRLEYLECRKLYVQSKFNGDEVMRKYGLKNKVLGDALSGFKTYIISEYKSYNDYIIHTNTSDIYKEFEEYLSENELEVR
jgi:hypothetical protein